MSKFLFIFLFLISCKVFSENEIDIAAIRTNAVLTTINENSVNKPSPIFFNFFRKKANRKKIIASLLAFPIPGGILGLHRIYLGTKPYVPVIYIVTLGGGLFILPIIDFFVLLCNKDVSRFQNHPGIFMWVDNEQKPTENKTN
ncbi:MAG: NINE protein [Bacteroidia bacterium]